MPQIALKDQALCDPSDSHFVNKLENHQGSPNVFCEGIAVVRQGDTFSNECGGSEEDCPHTEITSVSVGSSSVFANGLPLARLGDLCANGKTVISGVSSTVVAGG